MRSTTAKETRLVARASTDVQELIKRAADLTGATISQFIIEAATAKANTVIEKSKNLQLTLQGADTIFDALDNPAKPNKALLEAANRFRKNRGFHLDGNTGTGQKKA